ncbi:hypothetical protein ACLI4R_04530 [Natrialbaceae archaeon A-chndr2]
MSNTVPPAVRDAVEKHEAYLAAIQGWQEFCAEAGDELLLWTYVDRTIKAADATGWFDGQSNLRDAIGLPKINWIESLFGLDDYNLEDYLSGEQSTTEGIDLMLSSNARNEFVLFGVAVRRKREAIETRAKALYDHLVSDRFTAGFAQLNYTDQVTYAARLTDTLDASDYGLRILRTVIVPRDHDGNPQRFDWTPFETLDAKYEPKIFPALQLVDPTRITDNIITHPGSSDEADIVAGTDGWEINSPELGANLSLLVTNLSAGIVASQADDDLAVTSGQLQALFRTYSTTFDEPDLADLCEDDQSPSGVIETAASIFDDSKTLNDGLKPKIENQYGGGSEGVDTFLTNIDAAFTVTTVGISAIAALNQDELDFTTDGATELIGSVGDIAGLVDDSPASTTYRRLEFQTRPGGSDVGFIRKRALTTPEMSAGAPVARVATRLCSVIEIVNMLSLMQESAQDGEFDLMLLGGVNLGLLVAGSVSGGPAGLAFAFASIGVTLLIAEFDNSGFDDWLEHTVFGVETPSAIDTTDPSSQFFGFDTYTKQRVPGETETVSGLPRQISGFYNHTQGFSVPNQVVVSEKSGSWTCEVPISDIDGGSTSSAFYFRVVFFSPSRDRYHVSRLLYKFPAIIRDGSGNYNMSYTQTHDSPVSDASITARLAEVMFETGQTPDQAGDALETWTIELSSDTSVTSLFGVSPPTGSSSDSFFDSLPIPFVGDDDAGPHPYLEVMMAPNNLQSEIAADLALASTDTSASMVDTVLDSQPHPRKRIQITFE